VSRSASWGGLTTGVPFVSPAGNRTCAAISMLRS